jgi:tetratricopeptide (TPR) repeat protein
LEPNHAVAHFYYGVSLLLLGKHSEAITPLQQAVQLSVAELHESSRYYLALAYLKTNHPREAMAELEAVANMNGPHREAAAQLKQKVDEGLK